GDHAPTDGHDDVRSCQSPSGPGPAQLVNRLEALGFFAVVDEERALLDGAVDRDGDLSLSHHGRALRSGRYHLCQPVPGADADQHRVRPLAELDSDLDHEPPSRPGPGAPARRTAWIFSTAASASSWSTSTTRSASCS